MPLYMDVHRDMDATPEEIERAHLSDLEAAVNHEVHYLKYWFDEDRGNVCCLVDAPSRDACEAVHRESHGNTADTIIEDEAAMRVLRAHDAIIRASLSSCDGREVKHTGGGIMASFVSASRAVECAIRIQEAFEDAAVEDPDAAVEFRIGLSAGEPVIESHDLFGATVQLARRICDEADPGEIWISRVVCDLCFGKTFDFEDLGERRFRGFDDPARVFAVRWRDSAAA